MAIERTLLVLADIGGYTQFMSLHRMSLAHAQERVARLLEAMIDAAPRLRLMELEGDAAFFHMPCPEGQETAVAQTLTEQIVGMHGAFHARQQHITVANVCPCDGCIQVGDLRVKFVAHVGEVATQRVKNVTKLAGVDVILVHRMLKNSVPIPEYLLMSEALWQHTNPLVRDRARGLAEDFEGLGTTQTYYVDLAEIAHAVPPRPRISFTARWREHLGVTARSLPYMLGLKKPCAGFRNLADGEAHA
jgi:hypothetical protein